MTEAVSHSGMKFTCRFKNESTGELKDLICELDSDEARSIKRVRAKEGSEKANQLAASYVLSSAYRDIDANEWSHLGPPKPAN